MNELVLNDYENDMLATINSNQQLIIQSGNAMILTAMESGRVLIKLKAAIKAKGLEWMVWQNENLVLSNRQCSKYMKLASKPAEVENLLKEMGEDASINAIVGKIGTPRVAVEQRVISLPAKTPGYIYVVVFPEIPNLCKVGKTTNLDRRLRELNSESSSPGNLTYHGFMHFADMDNEEWMFHDTWNCYRRMNHHTGRQNEWFDMDPDRAMEYLKGNG